MENASKALLMAGGVLLTMLVISLLLYAWSSISAYQASQDAVKEVQQLAEFNSQYTSYNRDDVQGYELISLINKVIDYNQRYSSEFNSASSVGNTAQYKPITITIKLDKSSSDYTNRDKFTGIIKVPAVAKISFQNMKYDEIYDNSSYSNPTEKTYIGSDYRLFNNCEYKQSNTSNKFKNILDTISGIESYFGGATNARDLTKSISTIYESKIINYNGQPSSTYEASSWYQQSYVEGRYKTLTRNDLSIDYIRSEESVEKVLQYYEYVEFKKAEFKCTGVTYDDNTSRVTGMSFEIKE